MPFPGSFLTARLRAERLQPEHTGEVHRMHQDPVQMAMLGGIRDVAQTADYMERNLRHWAEHGFGLWLLWETLDNRVVGRALLRHLWVDERDEIEVGYSFYPAVWGRGLASEITAACLVHARERLRVPSVVALTTPANERSQRVLRRAGMAFEREIDHVGERHALFRTAPGW